MMLGHETKILMPSVRFEGHVSRDWKGKYLVIADPALNRDGSIAAGEVLGVSATYDGALRVVEALGSIEKRIAIRKMPA